MGTLRILYRYCVYLAFMKLKIEEVENLYCKCWEVWNSRNHIVFGIKGVQASMVAEKAHQFHEDYLIVNFAGKGCVIVTRFEVDEALSYSSQINSGWSCKCNIGNKLWCVTVMGT